MSRKQHDRTRDELIAELTRFGFEIHGAGGNGCTVRQWAELRDNSEWPGPYRTYTIIMNTPPREKARSASMAEWTDMLMSVGLRYPPPLKSGREAAIAKRMGLPLTKPVKIEHVELADHGLRTTSYRKYQNGVNTFGWEPKIYLIHGRYRRVSAARCW